MRLLVFDLDGTLTDSVPDIAAAVNRTLASRGLPPQTDLAVAAMVGDGLQPLIERAFKASGGLPDASAGADYLADYERNVSSGTRLYPGIVEAMDELHALGWTMAVCTNKPARAAHLLLDALGVAGRFAAVGGGDSFPTQKPNPGHLQGTIRMAGGSENTSLMVGDNSNDINAARGCNVKSIYAGWGYGRPGMEEGATDIALYVSDLVRTAEHLLPL